MRFSTKKNYKVKCFAEAIIDNLLGDELFGGREYLTKNLFPLWKSVET